MQVVSSIASKGGVGKTTLLFALGIEAAKTKSVLFIDLDPQQSLTRLCDKRDKYQPQLGLVAEAPLLLEGVKNIQEAIAKLERAGLARDIAFVDSPGSMMPIVKAVVGVSDCILLPLQPSILDIEAQEDAADIVKDHEKDERLLVVLNRVAGKVDAATEAAMKRFGKAPVRISNRVDYSRSLMTGKSAAEVNQEAANEISDLWTAVQNIIREYGHGKDKLERLGEPKSSQALQGEGRS
jgi:cellulose biosynthesis protein BcsQ